MSKCKQCRWYYICNNKKKLMASLLCSKYINTETKNNTVDITDLIGGLK